MKKPDFSLALIDADIVAYRCSIACQDDSEDVCSSRIDELMGYCVSETVGFAVEGNVKSYLTGKDNFRYEIAKSHPYKGNRKDKEKPTHLGYARGYLQDKWGAVVIDGAEADDAIAMEAVKHPDSSVIISQDKDFNTVPVWKYNFVKDEWRYDDEWSALQYFYTQILTGDTADNIVGLWRVGPVKAGKLIEHCETEQNLWEVCLKAYENDYDRVVENARLLHLQRFKDELWQPPE